MFSLVIIVKHSLNLIFLIFNIIYFTIDVSYFYIGNRETRVLLNFYLANIFSSLSIFSY